MLFELGVELVKLQFRELRMSGVPQEVHRVPPLSVGLDIIDLADLETVVSVQVPSQATRGNP